MRNIVGQPVSGTDFFRREAITRLIYRLVDSGSHLFMAVPRRVGKTSIMYNLRDKPREGYTFIYVATEEVDSSELYFRRLFKALLDSYYKRLKDAFSKEDYKLALEVLNLVAAKDSILRKDMFDQVNNSGATDNLKPIIESLEYDGYINLRDDYYTFNSPILQLWWNKYVRN